MKSWYGIKKVGLDANDEYSSKLMVGYLAKEKINTSVSVPQLSNIIAIYLYCSILFW